jgi:predicted KAP-like P-loop ATPase
MQLQVVSDAIAQTSRDLLHFERYVAPLTAIFADPDAETPFTVGIFGTWGSGKSTLIRMLNEKLEQEYIDRFVRVDFNPWVHRNEPNMLVPLLHTLQDALLEDRGNRFRESAAKIGNVLLRLGADFLLRHLTADAVSLEKLESLEEDWKEQRGKVISEIRQLHKTLQQEVNNIAARGARVILFIDDLVRFQPTEMIDLLE